MLRHFSLLAAFCGALTMTSPQAHATGDLDDLVRIDILDGGLTARGTYQAALKLTLKEGWKTYWRAPGDSGIPPEVDWQGSRNLGDVAITWPAPEVFDQDGLRSIGYHGQLVLPVEITPATSGQPVRMRGELTFGMCKDVCIPGRLDFDHALDADAGRNPAIAAALAQRPYSATEAGVSASTCNLRPASGGGMRIEARITMPSSGGREIAVIEPGDPQIWASQTETTRQGGTLIAISELEHVSGKAFALDRSQVRITVLGQRHAVDIRGCKPG